METSSTDLLSKAKRRPVCSVEKNANKISEPLLPRMIDTTLGQTPIATVDSGRGQVNAQQSLQPRDHDVHDTKSRPSLSKSMLLRRRENQTHTPPPEHGHQNLNVGV
ncbi:hypothetical protein RHMOL_Rhmol04G0074300 [Rhododendron molle]|uniref:Uncharacterized protein n=1 Tax=Rhododendron molle TaxID=49168 RepID=A0ACC0NXY0_RHOML|nr:hypothetical protein RHMOL_Rhmol04G0074300 [Rhododendron molle]